MSFLETGRSNPRRDAVLSLSRALGLPLRDRNVLLRAAGFAGLYPERALDGPERSHLRSLLYFLLHRLEQEIALRAGDDDLEELRVATFLPADEETDEFLRSAAWDAGAFDGRAVPGPS